MANQESLIIKNSGGTEADVTSDNALKVDGSAAAINAELLEVLTTLNDTLHRVGDKVYTPAYMTATGDVRIILGNISTTTLPISGSITNLTSIGAAAIDQSFTLSNQNRQTYIPYITQHITRS